MQKKKTIKYDTLLKIRSNSIITVFQFFFLSFQIPFVFFL